eukprot:scaffold118_cov382-Prasinococcus_capsulatus_cf.AAC.4
MRSAHPSATRPMTVSAAMRSSGFALWMAWAANWAVKGKMCFAGTVTARASSVEAATTQVSSSSSSSSSSASPGSPWSSFSWPSAHRWHSTGRTCCSNGSGPFVSSLGRSQPRSRMVMMAMCRLPASN